MTPEQIRAVGSIFKERRHLCATCPTPCENRPNVIDLSKTCPLPEPRWPKIEAEKRGLGDIAERLVKPIAKALKLPCLDKDGKLRQESGCAKRRDMMNRAGQAVSNIIKSTLNPNAE